MSQVSIPRMHEATVAHWINGVAVKDGGERMGEIWNPATGELRGRVPFADAMMVDRAVTAAEESFAAWRDTPAVKRARVMFRFKDLIERHLDELAAIITAEHGKVLSDAKGSVQRGLEVVEFACGIPHLLKGEFSSDLGPGIDCHSIREPIGICIGVTPFNFPAMVPLWMFPLAIACGNTFILKPSEKVPSCAMRLAELLDEAGLPPGVFNVLHGGRETVDILLEDRRTAAVSFVGSTPVAEYIYRKAAVNGMRVQSLGGAKNHMVVLPDADVEQAADALLGAAYGSAGERCMAISVTVAVGDAGERLREALIPRIQALSIGPGDQAGNDMGPLITKEHRDRVIDFIESGVLEGAELVVDGRSVRGPDCGAGFFLGPSLFDHATGEMRIYREEIFGPVLTMVRVDDAEQALELVNSHEFGNGAAIFTGSGRIARDFSVRVEAGMVGVNVPIPVPLAFYSFGGRKRSLFGDSNVHGTEGIRFYTRHKTITSRWPQGSTANLADLNMPTPGR